VECYVPEPKRKFGYFTLPVLYGDSFIGRFDPKADRASKIFYVKSMHFEKGLKTDDELNHAFAGKLKNFAEFNGCERVEIVKAESKWKKKMQTLVNKEFSK
jgi:uncharacterized protein YcaQ